MKKASKPQNVWFIYFSLVIFASIFLATSFAYNSLLAHRPASGRIIRPSTAAPANNQNYIIEKTADPFVTRVIKK